MSRFDPRRTSFTWDRESNTMHDLVLQYVHIYGRWFSPMTGVMIDLTMLGDERPVYTKPDLCFFFGVEPRTKLFRHAMAAYVDGPIHTLDHVREKDQRLRTRLGSLDKWTVKEYPYIRPSRRQAKLLARRILEDASRLYAVHEVRAQVSPEIIQALTARPEP